ELLEMNARALVAAVLRPHDREDAELGLGRLSLQRANDALVFLRGDRAHAPRLAGARSGWAPETAPSRVSAASTDSNMTRPSALPSDASHARSGCRIRPTTLRASPALPGIAVTE